MTRLFPRAQSHLTSLVEDQVSIIISNALGQVDIGILFLAIDIAQDSPQNGDAVVSFAIKSDIFRSGVEVTAVPVEVAIIVPDVIIEIDGGLLLITILIAKNSLEDVTILKLDVGSRFVEAHIVDLGEKNAK